MVKRSLEQPALGTQLISLQAGGHIRKSGGGWKWTICRRRRQLSSEWYVFGFGLNYVQLTPKQVHTESSLGMECKSSYLIEQRIVELLLTMLLVWD